MIALVMATLALHGCHEDQRCWNWATMGNHRRGIVTRQGRREVVTLCRFGAIWFDIDWTKTRHLRGDMTALERC